MDELHVVRRTPQPTACEAGRFPRRSPPDSTAPSHHSSPRVCVQSQVNGIVHDRSGSAPVIRTAVQCRSRAMMSNSRCTTCGSKAAGPAALRGIAGDSVEPGDQSIEVGDILEALYGGPLLHFDPRTGGLLDISRSEKRVFLNSRNTRMGAVYYHEWRSSGLGISTTEVVFHNPFATMPIQSSI